MVVRYARLVDGRLEFAPKSLKVDGAWVMNPSRRTYLAAGWKMFVDAPSPKFARDGMHWERVGWRETPVMIVPDWRLVRNAAPAPRRWTRLSLKTALAQSEMLDAAKAYLQSVEIATGYTAWEALTDADYIEEGFGGAEKWNAILNGAAVALGKTRAEIDAFLAAVPTEGGD